MSAGQKALGFVKAILTLKEQLDALGHDMTELGTRVTRLAEAHGDLRDGVSRLKGVIEGAAMATGRQQPRIEA